MRSNHILLGPAMAVVLLLVITTAGAQEANPIGTLTIEAKQDAAGLGFAWANGTLIFQGKKYRFSLKGLNAVAVGISKVGVEGDIYKMKNLSDFDGKYVAVEGGAAQVKGSTGLIMKNQKGVIINLRPSQGGVVLNPRVEGVSISMRYSVWELSE